MNLQGITAALALIGALCGFRADAAEPDIPKSTACAITNPKGGSLGNDSLAAVLPGKFIFRPGGPGFVDADGALGIKVGWKLRKKGTLFVTGRRLDGVAPPARAYIPRAYDDYVGGMSLFLVFPTPGCWEITGTLAEESLTFVVQVEKIGDGPPSRMHGPPSGWRLTKRWSEREVDKPMSFTTLQRVGQRRRVSSSSSLRGIDPDRKRYGPYHSACRLITSGPGTPL